MEGGVAFDHVFGDGDAAILTALVTLLKLANLVSLFAFFQFTFEECVDILEVELVLIGIFPELAGHLREIEVLSRHMTVVFGKLGQENIELYFLLGGIAHLLKLL